jgi:response regulator NasT
MRVRHVLARSAAIIPGHMQGKDVDDQPRSVVILSLDPPRSAVRLSAATGLGWRVVGPAEDMSAAGAVVGEENDWPDVLAIHLLGDATEALVSAAQAALAARAMPVVVMGDSCGESEKQVALQLGAYACVADTASAEVLSAAVAVAWDRFSAYRQLQAQVIDLEAKLRERKLIERAKGLLMQRLNIAEPEAMRRLQKQARDSRRPMAALAQAIIDEQQAVK